MSDTNKVVIEVEEQGNGYVGAYFGDEFDFTELQSSSLPSLLRSLADKIGNEKDFEIVGSSDEGVKISFQAETVVPWQELALKAMKDEE